MDVADVIVVGAGGAGLSAAIAASRAGARVVVLEKGPAVGGSTGLSVGSFSAAGTGMQRRKGIADDPDAFLETIRGSNGELEEHDNPELRELLVRNAAATFDWLCRLGVRFFGPTIEPPSTTPRMHNVVPNSRAYVRALATEAGRAGVAVHCESPVERLDVDRGGRVVGVIGERSLRARRGVVLATGDYSASREMRARYVSRESSLLPSVNTLNTGDGIAMALELGAEARNMWRIVEGLRFVPSGGVDLAKQLPSHPAVTAVMKLAVERLPRGLLRWFAQRALTSWIEPSPELFAHGAVLVNAEGRRFSDGLDAPARAVAAQPGNRCYIVFDDRIAARFRSPGTALSTFPGIAYAYLEDYERLRPDVTARADGLDELATRLGLPAVALRETVARVNALADAGHDADFGQPLGTGLRQPPFYALGPLFGIVTLTDGGVVVNPRFEVLGSGGVPIPGLYAAGATGQSGLILNNHGLHLAWAMTSGLLAGRSAAVTASTQEGT